jgi:glycosyltransferase involved in cell wall biosynthesis
VVTPFYNTAPYLAECIKSVLAQTHANYEYILVNNKSTDGSRDIAQRFANEDPRIRLFDNDVFVGQLENYNGALDRIGVDSKYVKMVQADDALFPECVERLVDLAEREASVGIVSSHYQWGDDLCGGGIDRCLTRVSGREVCRRILLERRQFTGSQTTVLYRADIVRARRQFFPLGRLFADTDAAFEILLEHDLGYVHQILSFSRKQNESTLNSVLGFHPFLLHLYMSTERYGPSVLSPDELKRVRADMTADYYAYLGAQLIRFRGSRFWDYHRAGLATLGKEIAWSMVAEQGVLEAARLMLNPESTLRRIGSFIRKIRRERDANGAGKDGIRRAAHDAGRPGEAR